MRCPHIDDEVCLNHDIPELSLTRGQVGIVRSTWFAPTIAYEVEFQKVGLSYQTRALLLQEQLTLSENIPPAPSINCAAEYIVPYVG